MRLIHRDGRVWDVPAMSYARHSETYQRAGWRPAETQPEPVPTIAFDADAPKIVEDAPPVVELDLDAEGDAPPVVELATRGRRGRRAEG